MNGWMDGWMYLQWGFVEGVGNVGEGVGRVHEGIDRSISGAIAARLVDCSPPSANGFRKLLSSQPPQPPHTLITPSQ